MVTPSVALRLALTLIPNGRAGLMAKRPVLLLCCYIVFIENGFSPFVPNVSVLLCSGSAGYCFVELADEASVDRCVQRLNGKLVPGSNPVSSMV